MSDAGGQGHDTLVDESLVVPLEATEDEGRPRKIGRYLVVDVLGAGGMGTVFEAHDPELDRKVALKLLHGREDGSAHATRARSRLQREARAIAKVRHPNVIHVYDVGVVQHEGEEQVFVAMELVEGRSLRRWLEQLHNTDRWRRGEATEEIVKVMAQAARGLAAAHAADLVHRDFKPDNALLGDDGLVRVVDFGLARRVDHSSDSINVPSPRAEAPEAGREPAPATLGAISGTGSFDERLTRTGARLGTPAYMAPEQFRGDPTDGRTDQFALCLVLYEALLGVRAFPHGGYALALSVMRGEQRPWPSSPSVPGHLRALLQRGLQTDPEDRFPSMDALVEALLDDPARRRRERMRWVLGGTAVLGAAGALVITRQPAVAPEDPCGHGRATVDAVWTEERARTVRATLDVDELPYAAHVAEAAVDALDHYAEDWQQAHRDACEATHVRHEQTGTLLDERMACLDRRLSALDASIALLAEAGPEQVEHAVAAVRGLPSLKDCADRAALEATGPPPPDATTQAAVAEVQAQFERTTAWQRLNRFDEALTTVEAVGERVASLGHPPLQAEYLYVLGDARILAQQIEPGVESVRQSLMQAQALGMDPLVRDAASRLSLALGTTLGRPEEAVPWAELAEATDQRLGSTPATQARLLRQRAWVLVEWGMKREAIDVVDQAHAAALEAYEPDDYAMQSIYSSLGSVYARLGEMDRARPHFERAVELGEKHLGPDHPSLLNHYRNLGNVLSAMNEVEEADRWVRRAADLAERIPGINARERALIASSLGNQALKRHDFEEALAQHAKALRLREEVYGPEHPMVARSLNSLGATAKRLERIEDATRWYQRSLAIREKTMGPEHPSLLIVLDNIAVLLVENGQLEEALPYLERADVLMNEHGDAPYREADHRFWYGRALVETGRDPTRGMTLVEDALERFREIEHEDMAAKVSGWLEAQRSK